MKRYIMMLFFIVVVHTGNAHANPIIADLSLREINIDSHFNGEEILFFGARNDAGDVVIVIRGPEDSYVSRKKEHIAGIWINNEEKQFQNIIGFYAIAASRDISEIKNDILLNNLSIDYFSFDDDEFGKAIVRKKEGENLYSMKVGKVDFMDDTLFRTIIKFPNNIPRGTYLAETYLFTNGQLTALQVTPLIVSKKGFDAFTYDFAHNHPMMYGVVAVLVALAAGWVAGNFLRRS